MIGIELVRDRQTKERGGRERDAGRDGGLQAGDLLLLARARTRSGLAAARAHREQADTAIRIVDER